MVDPPAFWDTLRRSCNGFDNVVALSSNGYHGRFPHPLHQQFSQFEWLIGASNSRAISSLDELKHSADAWKLGLITYDESRHVLLNGQPPATFGRFFIPDQLTVSQQPSDAFVPKPFLPKSENIALRQQESEEDYILKIQKIQQHIRQGDIYEINYCMAFHAEAEIDPVEVFGKLSEISPNPFSAFVKFGHQYMMCSSMERFMQHRAGRLITQPIKGTASVNQGSLMADNHKERAENIMAVDVARNDLALNCHPGTVRTIELAQPHPYGHVSQLVSTVSGQLRQEIHPLDAMVSALPMASMTGAPKRRAAELIHEFETETRGEYSGTIGYIDPEGNFDFNVIIRTLRYNELTAQITANVGAAITLKSDPAAEYQECLLKLAGLQRALNPQF